MWLTQTLWNGPPPLGGVNRPHIIDLAIFFSDTSRPTQNGGIEPKPPVKDRKTKIFY